MNLRDAHRFLGELLEAGVSPEIPLVTLIDGQASEVSDFGGLNGAYLGDPSPSMVAFTMQQGSMLVALAQLQDLSEPPAGCAPFELPIECLAPAAQARTK